MAAVNADVKADAEVIGTEGSVRAVLLQSHLAFEEGTLWRAAVDLFGLGDHDRIIFEEIEDHDKSESMVFKTALDNAFFKVCIKSQHL